MKQKVIIAALLVSLTGCSAAKSWFGTPVRTEAIVRACQDGQKDLEQLHAQLMMTVTDSAQRAWLQQMHDRIQSALANCVQVGQG